MGIEFEDFSPTKIVKGKNKSFMLVGVGVVGILALVTLAKKGTSSPMNVGGDDVTSTQAYAMLQSSEKMIQQNMEHLLDERDKEFEKSLDSLVNATNNQFSYLEKSMKDTLEEFTKKNTQKQVETVTSSKSNNVYYYDDSYTPPAKVEQPKTDGQLTYLNNLVDNGSQGNKIWAMYERDKILGTNDAPAESQKIYLTNLATSGSYGEKEWAKKELSKLG